jgi:hypothetical protein
MAEDFIRAVMKDNLINYVEEVVDDESDNKAERNKKMVSFMEQLNGKNCGCTNCTINKGFFEKMEDKRNDKVVICKYMSLNRSTFFKIHFNPNKFKMENRVRLQNKKEVVMRSLHSSKEDIKISFVMDKKVKNPDLSYNFARHTSTLMDTSDKNGQISLSAFMVVKAMRELKESVLDEVNRVNNLNPEELNNCFRVLFLKIMNKEVKSEFCFKIIDLEEEEEMEFLTKLSGMKLYIKIDENNMKLNHIDLTYFEESKEVDSYIIFTPEFRGINFFNSENSSAYLDLALDNNTSLGFENLNLEDMDPSVIQELKQFKRTDFQSKVGKVDGNFLENKFLQQNSNQSFHRDALKMMMKSSLSKSFCSGNSEKVSILRLSIMSLQEFKAISLFTKDLKELNKIVYSEPLNVMKQSLSILPKMFFELIFYPKTSSLDRVLVAVEYKKFLNQFKEAEMEGEQLIHKFFFDFKQRVYHYIRFNDLAHEFDQDFISMMNNPMYKEAADPESIFMYKIMMMEKINSNEKMSIKKYQPSLLTNSIMKNMDDDILEENIKDSNEWFENWDKCL